MTKPEGVLLTGVYGSGKSTTLEEIAARLEQQSCAFAAIDVDWLWWFETDKDGVDHLSVLQLNLHQMIRNYLDAGVHRFVMAWALKDQSSLELVRTAAGFPLRVARLSAAAEVISERLGGEQTAQRANQDLTTAMSWLRDGTGADIGDVEIRSDRPVEQVARDVLEWLGWS